MNINVRPVVNEIRPAEPDLANPAILVLCLFTAVPSAAIGFILGLLIGWGRL